MIAVEEDPTVSLLMVWTAAALPEGLGAGPWESAFSLSPTLHLVAADVGRSPVYHAVKDLVPADTGLAVAVLDGPPKAKAVAPGLAAWLEAQA